MSFPSAPPVWPSQPPPSAPAAPDQHQASARRVAVVLVAIAVVALLATAVALGVLLYGARQDVTRLGRERAQARDDLRAAQADLDDVRRQLASSQEDVQSLNAKLAQAPSQANCSSVRFPAGWNAQENIVVVCGPHAQDATDAIVEYRIQHDDVSAYLHTHYPLNVVLLDLNFSTS